VVSDQYDVTAKTCDTYRHPDYIVENKWGRNHAKDHDSLKHGALHGEFNDIRERMDYNWHTNYSKERQSWQDNFVRSVAMR